MKRLPGLGAILVSLLILFAGCEGFLTEPVSPLEQAQSFASAASQTPQNPVLLQSYFDPAAADYGSMQLQSYWDARFFNNLDGPYGVTGGVEGGEDPLFPGSVTVTANVTNTFGSYPVEFVFTTDSSELFADPLIRKITVDVSGTPEVIERVVPAYE